MRKKKFEEVLEACFGRNDIRCRYGSELNSELIYMIGRASALFFKGKRVIVGRDLRPSSKAMSKILIKGLTDQGVNVIDVGLVDTPAVYFASGKYKKPALVVTASHNPKEYNGLKIVKENSEPVSENTGLNKIKEIIRKSRFPESRKKGKVEKKDILRDYRKHVLSFIKVKKLKPLKIVVDSGGGISGRIIPFMFKGLPFEIIKAKKDKVPVYVANPVKARTTKELRALIKKNKADFGVSFDGDMDRVYFIDEKGKVIGSSVIAGLLIKDFLTKKPKSSIVYNTVCSKAVPEIAEEYGGKAILEKTGHSYIKNRMKKTNSVFGCEHSAHYYYKENYYADSGIITTLLVAEIFSREGKKISEILKEFKKYEKDEERSFRLTRKSDGLKLIKKIKSSYRKVGPRNVSEEDGLTMEFDDWWFNVRVSGTQNLLRVNVEAKSAEEMRNRSFTLLQFIKSIRSKI